MSTSDHSRLLPRRPQATPATHSNPASEVPQVSDAVSYPTPSPVVPPRMSLLMRPSTPTPVAAQPEHMSYEHAIDFATHSWDLKTGGLKTLTAKREFPTRLDRRSSELQQEVRASSSSGNYTFAMIVLVCVIFMLIGGGVILFVMLQP